MEKSNFRIIADEVGQLLDVKNKAYGSSTNMTYEIFGMKAYLVRMYDKINRLTNLVENGGAENDESIEDTLRDLAGYSILAINQLQLEKSKATTCEITVNSKEKPYSNRLEIDNQYSPELWE